MLLTGPETSLVSVSDGKSDSVVFGTGKLRDHLRPRTKRSLLGGDHVKRLKTTVTERVRKQM